LPLFFLPVEIPSARTRSDKTWGKNLWYQSGVPVLFAYIAQFSLDKTGCVLLKRQGLEKNKIKQNNKSKPVCIMLQQLIINTI
jgi:hypothetical protein